MSTSPRPSFHSESVTDLPSRFGSIAVADDGFVPPHPSTPQYVPNISHNFPNIHIPNHHSNPYMAPNGEDDRYYTTGPQPALGPPFSPTQNGSNGSPYLFGSPPPDVTPPSALLQGGFPLIGRQYHPEQNLRANGHAHPHQVSHNGYHPQTPTSGASQMVYRPPHPQQQMLPHQALQQRQQDAANARLIEYQNERQFQWVPAQQGMYIGGETRKDMQVCHLLSSEYLFR